MIRHQDLKVLESALLDLYAPDLAVTNYAGRAFALLNRIVRAEMTGLIVRDTAQAKIDICLDFTPPDLQHFGEAFGTLAPKYPWFQADPRTHDGRAHCRSDFCSDRQFRDLDIHDEIFRHWGHRHFMSMYVHTESDRVVFFGFNRARRDFSGDERELVALARSHLSNARLLALALHSIGPSFTPELLVRLGFTPRESEVLYWLTEGKSNVEIAAILRIGLPTVKGYVTAIFNKTGVGNRQAASLHALELAKKATIDPAAFSHNRPSVHVPYHLPLPK